MLTNTVPIDDNTRLGIAASRSGAPGLSLTVVEGGVAKTSVYLPDREQAHLLLASLIDAARHLEWLSEGQAAAMVWEMRRKRLPRWRRWLPV